MLRQSKRFIDFDTFEAITGRNPTTWPAFAHKHRQQFLTPLDDTTP